MKIQVTSDLHLEFGYTEVKNLGADVLVLSGDICVAEDLYDYPETAQRASDPKSRRAKAESYRDFFAQVSRDFELVVYVAGNHEFYRGKWKKTHEILTAECAKFPNVVYLDKSLCVHKGVTFLGGTMWTDMNRNDPLTLHAVRDMMNDYSVIRDDTRGFTALRPAITSIECSYTLGYFKAVLSDMPEDAKVVVVTHHAPSFQSVHHHYKDEVLMNGAYASDFSEFILDRPQIKLWTHGHMHDPSDYMLGDTRVVCSPRGYAGTSESWQYAYGKVVEI